jgi:hypothetical protein
MVKRLDSGAVCLPWLHPTGRAVSVEHAHPIDREGHLAASLSVPSQYEQGMDGLHYPSTIVGGPGTKQIRGRSHHAGLQEDTLGWTVSKLYPDPSGCGHFLAAALHQSDGRRVRAVGVYLPTASFDKEPIMVQNDTPEGESNIKSSSALATKIHQYLASIPGLQQYPTAKSWFWYRMQILIADSKWEVILVGDFNHTWPNLGKEKVPSAF